MFKILHPTFSRIHGFKPYFSFKTGNATFDKINLTGSRLTFYTIASFNLASGLYVMPHYTRGFPSRSPTMHFIDNIFDHICSAGYVVAGTGTSLILSTLKAQLYTTMWFVTIPWCIYKHMNSKPINSFDIFSRPFVIYPNHIARHLILESTEDILDFRVFGSLRRRIPNDVHDKIFRAKKIELYKMCGVIKYLGGKN